MLRKIGFYLLLCILLSATPIFGQEDSMDMISDDSALVEELGEGVVTGEVTAVNATSNTITIKIEAGKEKTFSVIEGETIIWKGIEDIELSDIAKGQEAEVGYYTDDTGTLIASWVDVLIEEEATPSVGEEETMMDTSEDME